LPPLLPLLLLLLLLQVLMKPDLVGPDGTATSFFSFQDAAGVWRFYGTCAAAPNVAACCYCAVAALMIQQNPKIKVGDNIMQYVSGSQVQTPRGSSTAFVQVQLVFKYSFCST
jgi:hypothetical protein